LKCKKEIISAEKTLKGFSSCFSFETIWKHFVTSGEFF